MQMYNLYIFIFEAVGIIVFRRMDAPSEKTSGGRRTYLESGSLSHEKMSSYSTELYTKAGKQALSNGALPSDLELAEVTF